MSDIEQVKTFGDVRQLILQTVINIRDGGVEPNQAMAMFTGIKVLNDNIQVEINAAKLALATEGKTNNFGKLVQMGRKTINGIDQQPAIEHNI